MQCWINDPATGGIDDKINPPAADHYSIPRTNSEDQKKSLYYQLVVEIPRRKLSIEINTFCWRFEKI
jgi:hypothetical protein